MEQIRTPLSDAEDKFFKNLDTDKVNLQDCFRAGWDARNEYVYKNYRIQIDKMKEELIEARRILKDLRNLQFSNGLADRANHFFERY